MSHLSLVAPLQNMSVSVPDGCLMGIVGVVGSGKSTLLQLLIGEVPLVEGWRTCTAPRIAYCTQHAWIFHSSLRDNIVFGEPFCAKRYAQVVRACALQTDFAAQPHGDSTIVQANSLSGGQRQRIGIARAAYSSAQTVVLDDPFSALDAQVTGHVFTHCIEGLMRHRTVLFTTNNTKLLTNCDLIGVLSEGSVVVDSYSNFIRATERSASRPHASAADILSRLTVNGSAKCNSQAAEETALPHSKSQPMKNANNGDVDDGEFYGISLDDDDDDTDHDQDEFGRTAHTQEGKSIHSAEESNDSGKTQHRMIGHLSRAVGGYHWLLLIVFTLLVEEAVSEYQLWLLATWTDEGESGTITDGANQRYVVHYAALVVAEMLVAYVRQVVVGITTVHTADRLHRQLVDMVQGVPLSYFTTGTTTATYVLDLFARDHRRIDRGMFMGVEYLLIPVSYWVTIATATAVVLPWTLVSFLVSSVSIHYLLRMHRHKSQRCRVWLSRTKQPVVQCITDTDSGRPTIRAFGCQETLLRKFGRCLDEYTNASAAVSVAMATTASLADAAGCVFNVGVALAIVMSRNDITTGEAGFMLTNAAFSAFAGTSTLTGRATR
ncbi:hypothetical protein SARC_03604 [Sphaeroforma arctica JP610]|uniref:ABC transporter domain-containing protein n=1 Tax=Sphaeroforma arctica JP610 TaxID=667725 RepID=A0A0L0G569_9EUKA|nr:hypothetical protein SARC_03604 [Sphaeroforma arctica JP610]KNC84182.1 hypothetical protein SARC_03604 [Sphaeroforma arctica JP610]|eukprot:XP_014158084.1 hypothetical protein SARC_03604 [Sphaeroforma arctica JP610]